MNPLAAALVSRVEWAALRAGPGTAVGLPRALRGLASAESEEDAKEWYWRVDNVVVVQGMLHESAPPTVPVLFALLAGTLSGPARYRVVELLVELAGGETAQSEVDRGDAEVHLRCQDAMRQGRWTVYGLLSDPDPRIRIDAITLLALLEDDAAQAGPVLHDIGANDPDPRVRAEANALLSEYGTAGGEKPLR
ncbi:hypothetical protein [Prauserella cavernicola]|uniref:HEAT repeat domain-containing protein n=1 Tax=Prauserella cavernicola TaxID=2800127 RepID=A0A934QUT6_9PSEU|nr:hypothetical protein [Prauserella cavernicola]MBK1786885.1 hypothetical protein [Prauserella cavernicola]